VKIEKTITLFREEIEAEGEKSFFKEKCLPSLVLIVLGVFVFFNVLVNKGVGLNFTYSIKFAGLLFQIFGVFLAVPEILIYFRKLIMDMHKRSRKSVIIYSIWEIFVLPKEELRMIFSLVGFFIVILLLSLFFGPAQPLVLDLMARYGAIKYVWLVAIIVIVIWVGTYWIMGATEKMLYVIIYGVIFIPRTVFWSIMKISHSLYTYTENLKLSRIVGAVFTISGMIINWVI